MLKPFECRCEIAQSPPVPANQPPAEVTIRIGCSSRQASATLLGVPADCRSAGKYKLGRDSYLGFFSPNFQSSSPNFPRQLSQPRPFQRSPRQDESRVTSVRHTPSYICDDVYTSLNGYSRTELSFFSPTPDSVAIVIHSARTPTDGIAVLDSLKTRSRQLPLVLGSSLLITRC